MSQKNAIWTRKFKLIVERNRLNSARKTVESYRIALKKKSTGVHRLRMIQRIYYPDLQCKGQCAGAMHI